MSHAEPVPPTAAAQTYIDRVLGRLADRDPIAVLADLDRELDTLLTGLTASELLRPEAPDRWSIHEVVHHLADAEIVYGYRLRLTLTLDTPRFERFDQDAWATRLAYRDAPLDTARAVLTTLRGRHLEVIRSLDEDDLARAGVHSGRGTETVDRLVRLWAGHDLAHRAQIARVRAAHSGGSGGAGGAGSTGS